MKRKFDRHRSTFCPYRLLGVKIRVFTVRAPQFNPHFAAVNDYRDPWPIGHRLDRPVVAAYQTNITTAYDSNKTALDTYSLLQAYFSRFFILSAAILTLLVLCTGALYGAVNSFDFIRLLSSNWGYSPVKTDIMLPAKFRFQQIHALLFPPPQDAATTNNGTPQPDTTNIWLDLLKDPFDKFKGVLVAASPFLASIIQSLFGLLFQH